MSDLGIVHLIPIALVQGAQIVDMPLKQNTVQGPCMSPFIGYAPLSKHQPDATVATIVNRTVDYAALMARPVADHELPEMLLSLNESRTE